MDSDQQNEENQGEKVPIFNIIVADMPPTGNMVALFEVPEDTMKHLLKYSLDIAAFVLRIRSKNSESWKSN